MKKTLLMLAVILTLGYLGSTWWIGRSLHAELQEFVDAQQKHVPFLTITEKRYTDGWFGAEQELTLALHSESLPEASQEQLSALGLAAATGPMTVHNVIRFGPLCGFLCVGRARIDTRIDYPQALKKVLEPVYGSNPQPVAISTCWGFFSDKTLTLSTPAVKGRDWGKLKELDFSGASITVRVSKNSDRVQSKGAMPLLHLVSDTNRLELRDLQFQNQQQRLLRELYTGTASMTLAKLSVEPDDASEHKISIEKISGSGSSTNKMPNFLDYGFQFGTGNITASGKSLSAIHFDFSVHHLNMKVLAELADQLAVLHKQGAAADSQHMVEAFRDTLETAGPKLMADQPQVLLDRISVESAQGVATISGLVHYPGTTSQDWQEDAILKTLREKLEANFDLSIDEGLLELLPADGASANEQLHELAKRGLITWQNGKIQTHISVKNDAILFNDKPLNDSSHETHSHGVT